LATAAQDDILPHKTYSDSIPTLLAETPTVSQYAKPQDEHVAGELNLHPNEPKCQIGPVTRGVEQKDLQREADSPEVFPQKFKTTLYHPVTASANSSFTFQGATRAQEP